jgi:orotidine-5'-phosphate decarboxylase
MIPAKERLVLPLDVPDLDGAAALVSRLHGEVGVFKVGLELFTAAGPAAVEVVHDVGAQCFLDLKLHDIPATMAGAVASAAELGVKYLTLHALAGRRALAAAREAADGGPTRLLAVTVLTSLDDEELGELGMAGTDDVVRRLARVSVDEGIDGLVCSARECEDLRRTLGADPLLVVPGIRPAGVDARDQRRTATPAAAIERGADLLVVGRPIREAADPVAAARAVVADIAAAAGGS